MPALKGMLCNHQCSVCTSFTKDHVAVRFRSPWQESWASLKKQPAHFHNQSYLPCLLFALATRKLKVVSKYSTGLTVGIAAHQLYSLVYLTIIPLLTLLSNTLIYLELRNEAGTKVTNRYGQASVELDPTLNWLELSAPSPNPGEKTEGGWPAASIPETVGIPQGGRKWWSLILRKE